MQRHCDFFIFYHTKNTCVNICRCFLLCRYSYNSKMKQLNEWENVDKDKTKQIYELLTK